jgi:hypothetical protein
LSKKGNVISKITGAKLAGGVAQAAKSLHSNHKALSSNSRNGKKRKNEKRQETKNKLIVANK